MPTNGQTAAGVTVPDTKLARDATDLVRESTTELVYHHSRRVFWFGSLQAQNRDLSFDPELLYIAAMFHDLGLNEEFRGSGRRFEVDSADEARRFLQEYGVPEDSIRRVWTAVALHTTPGIPEFMEPEVALVTAGVEYDVLGIGYHDVSDADRARTSSTTSSRRSPRASRPSRKRRSATSKPTCWSASSPATSAATSWTSSRTRPGRSRRDRRTSRQP
jgi:hypothetical protein